MKKQIVTAISTHPVRAAFLLLLPFLLGLATHEALAQRNTGKRSTAVDPSGVASPAYAFPVKPASNIPALSGAATAEPAGGGCTPGMWTQATPVGIEHYGGFMDSDGTFAYEGGGYSFPTGATINQFGKFDPVANTWTPLAPVPDLINAEASGVYAPNVNKLFVFGGDDPTTGTVVNTTRIYDIATGVWSTGAPMPDLRAFMGSGYYNGKIYLVGGYSTGNADPSFGQVWEYDPITNTWNTSRASMPITMGGPGFGIINGHIYIAGGRNLGNTNLDTLYDYDIAGNTWTPRANVPTGVNVPGSAAIGGKLWIFGGGNPFAGSAAFPKKGVFEPDTTNIMQTYDPATDSWSSGPTLNQQRAFPAGTHVGNTAVAVGGYTGSGTTASVEINICGGGGCTPSWRNEPSIANARRNPATAVVGSNLYAITGFNAAPDYTAVNERFDGTSWATLAPIPVPHAQSKGAVVGANIYVPGGFNSVSFGGPLDTMQIYNTTANTWSSGMNLPGTRGGAATAAFNGMVYVIAGYTIPFPTVTNTVFIYDPGTNSYTTGAPMPAGQGNVGGVLFNGEIYVVGGGTAPGAQYAYNPTTDMWRTIAPIPTSDGTCQSDNGFVFNNEMWVVGCLGQPINQQVWIYNSGTNSWRAGPPYTVDHQGPGAALFNNRGFAVGGGAAGGGSAAVESYGGCTPTPSSAVSRKIHGGAGTFDVDLPLVPISGAVGIEDRTGAVAGAHQMVVTFPSAVTVASAAVTSGTGSVGSFTGSGTTTITVNLTGVTNAQRLGVTLSNVTDGVDAGDVFIPMGVLSGDTAASGMVSAADVSQTKAQSGNGTVAGNFRMDVNSSGLVNAADVGLVKSKVGTVLPP